jgi:2-amino-4-hydroxy-6-hydroxymethyldihydropteridine diphosphokinase
MSVCLIGLGSNLGDRGRMLDEAAERLARHPAVRVSGRSPWRETPPVGGPAGQSPYLNGAVTLETTLEPEALLRLLHEIEAALGRRRQERWGPRLIDLDLLLYDQVVQQGPTLVLPHPRMTWRRFVLEPAAVVAAGMVHPLTGWTVRQHLDHLNRSALYLAITGRATARRTELARQLAARSGAEPLLAAPSSATGCAVSAAPAGQAAGRALELLDRWSALLSPAWAGWSAAAGVVSDFWFEEAIAWLPPPQREEVRARVEQARAAVVRPRLLVFLEEAGDGPELPGGRELAVLAARPGQGPLLRLAGDDPAAALPEVAAALEAMK